ncbi:hypothetical protein [Streptomyces acidicola]|uniref:hypothetical protein n=1 Tax=Streptomyces acidicola TaxID=2596892 RepID=UPI00381BF363
MAERDPLPGADTRPGPGHLRGLTEPALRPAHVSERRWAGLLDVGWTGRLRGPDGSNRFRLRYHGELYDGLITDEAQGVPALVYAVPTAGEPILLFDGAAHGCNALFCDTWDAGALSARRAEQIYIDADGEDTFELVVWVGYNIDWDEEDERATVEDPDDPGLARLVDGRRLPFPVVAADGFDAISVMATNNRGHAFDVVSEELA